MFKFPLQQVADLRESIQHAKSIDLKKSRVQLESEERKLYRLDERKRVVVEDSRDAGNYRERLSLFDLQVSSDYIQQLNQQIVNQAEYVRKSNELVERRREELVEATKDRKILEQLRNRRKTEYLKKLQKTELFKEGEVALQIIRNKKS